MAIEVLLIIIIIIIIIITIIIIIINNNTGLFTVYPPSGASPVKNYNIKNEKLQYTTKK